MNDFFFPLCTILFREVLEITLNSTSNNGFAQWVILVSGVTQLQNNSVLLKLFFFKLANIWQKANPR